MLADLVNLLVQGFWHALASDAQQVLVAAVGGVIAAVFFFLLCSWFTRQWNRAIHLTASHYLWCGVAAAVTMVLSLGGVATLHLDAVATKAVEAWSRSFEPRGSANYMRLWNAGKQALEQAGISQRDMPANKATFGSDFEKGLAISTKTTVSEAVRIFQEQHPLLHSLITTDLGPVTARMVDAARSDFAAKRGLEPDPLDPDDVKRARVFTEDIKVLQQEMDRAFSVAIPSFQTRALWVYGAIFVIVQLIPFLLSGFAAYRQIHIDPRRPARRGATSSSYGATKKRPPTRYRR